MKHRHNTRMASIMPFNGLYNKKGTDLARKNPTQERDDYIGKLLENLSEKSRKISWEGLTLDEQAKLAVLTHLAGKSYQQSEVFTDALSAASIASLAGEYSLYEDSSAEKSKSKLGIVLLKLIQESIEEYWAEDAEEYFTEAAEQYKAKWVESERADMIMSKESSSERLYSMLKSLNQKGAA